MYIYIFPQHFLSFSFYLFTIIWFLFTKTHIHFHFFFLNFPFFFAFQNNTTVRPFLETELCDSEKRSVCVPFSDSGILNFQEEEEEEKTNKIIFKIKKMYYLFKEEKDKEKMVHPKCNHHFTWKGRPKLLSLLLSLT